FRAGFLCVSDDVEVELDNTNHSLVPPEIIMGAVESTGVEPTLALASATGTGAPATNAAVTTEKPLVSLQPLVDSKSKKTNSRMHPSCCLDMAAQMASLPSLVRSLMSLSCTPEVGYDTAGHTCLLPSDLEAAKLANSSLLYGEVLPAVRAAA